MTVSNELLNYCVNIFHATADNCTLTTSIPCCFHGGFAANTTYCIIIIKKDTDGKLVIKAMK